MNETDYQDNPGYGQGSIHKLLFHLLVTDPRWRDDAIITASSGEKKGIPRWRILLHVVLDSMQHGAELAELLTLKGQSPILTGASLTRSGIDFDLAPVGGISGHI